MLSENYWFSFVVKCVCKHVHMKYSLATAKVFVVCSTSLRGVVPSVIPRLSVGGERERIKQYTLGWLNVSPYLWLLDSPCMHRLFLMFLFSVLLWHSRPLLPLSHFSTFTHWDCSGSVYEALAKYQRNNMHVMSVHMCDCPCITYKHKLTALHDYQPRAKVLGNN